MDGYLNPIKIMHYEGKLFNFLRSHLDEFEEEYRKYSTVREKLARESNLMEGKRDAPSILTQIYLTRKELDRCYKTGDMRYTKQVNDTIIMGRAISLLEEVSVVDPDLNRKSKGLEEVFANRIWKESDYWDTVFELEVATELKAEGLDPLLVDEGEQGGPDIIVELEGKNVWMECKRKRPLSEEERQQQKSVDEIIDSVYENLNIGHDSFGVEIRGDSFLNINNVDDIATAVSVLIQNQDLTTRSITSQGNDYKIELVDYFDGMRTIETNTKREIDNYLQGGNMINVFKHINMDISHDHSFSRNRSSVKVDRDNNILVSNASIFNIVIDDKIDYVRWVMESVEEGRRKISGHEPSIVCVDIPRRKINEMMKRTCIDHKGNKVALTKRLDQRVIGQLADSNSLNAVSITSRGHQTPSTGVTIPRYVRTLINENPGTKLPNEIEEFISF